MKLLTKLVFSVILISASAIFLIGVLIYSRTAKSLRDTVGKEEAQVAQRTLDGIRQWLDFKVKEVGVLTKTAIVSKRLNTPVKNNANSIAIDDEVSRVIINTGPWKNLTLINSAEEIVYSDSGKHVGTKLELNSQRSVALDMARNGKFYYSDLVIDDMDGGAVIFIALPVYDESKSDRPFLGAVVATINWNDILERLAAIKVPQLAYLYNSDGLFLGSSNADYNNGALFQNDYTNHTIKAVLSSPVGTSFLAPSIKSDYQSLISSAKSSGNSNIGSEWLLIVELPKTLAFAAVNVYTLETFIILSVMILFSSFLFVILVRFEVVNPVAYFIRTAKEITSGQIAKRVKINSRDEIGELARSFNAMTDSLARIGRYVQSIIMTMPTGLIIVDKDGKIKSVNEAICRIIGCKNERLLVNEKFLDFFSSDQLENDKLAMILRGKKVIDMRSLMRAGNKELVPVSLSTNVIFDDYGELDTLVVVVKDMRELTEYAKSRLAEVSPILRRAAAGDFNVVVPVSGKADEFSEHFTDINLMIQDLRRMVDNIKQNQDQLKNQNAELIKTKAELQNLTDNLEKEVTKRTTELKRKYQESDMLRRLNEELSNTLEVSQIMNGVAKELKIFFADKQIAWIAEGIVSSEKAMEADFLLSSEVSPAYCNAVIESLKGYAINHRPPASSGFVCSQEYSFVPKIVEGNLSEKAAAKPAFAENFSIFAPGAFCGVVNISSVDNFTLTPEDYDTVEYVLLSVSQMVTRLKALVASEQSRIGDVMQAVNSGVIIFDIHKKIISANLFARNLFFDQNTEMDLKDLAEDCFVEVKGNKNIHLPLSDTIDNVLATAMPVTIDEVWSKNKYFEVFVGPLKDYRNEMSGGVIIFYDISRLKELDNMKTEFVSIASHQMRTPLTGIKLLTETLLDKEIGNINEQQDSYLHDLQDAVNLMIRLVNDLLNVSRIEAGRLKIAPQPTDIAKLVQLVVNENTVLCKDRCQIFFSHTPDDFSQVSVDSDLFRQVVDNLVSNARAYSSEKSGRIDVSLSKKNNDIVLLVKDNGIGIAPAERDRIFEKFFRSGSAVKRRSDGSGLGLYVAQMVMEASGGKIWFESEGVNKGTTFGISLPASGMSYREGEVGLIA